MKREYDEGQVETAYARVRECVELAGAHLVGCIHFLGGNPACQGRKLAVTPESLDETVGRLSRMRAAVVEAGTLLDPLADDLPLVAKEPVSEGNMRAASWAEVSVAIAERHAMDLEDWQGVTVKDDGKLRALIESATRNMWDAPGLMVHLQVEEAVLRERARANSPEVRYAYEYAHLEGQSRRLFDFLVQNRGRRVETHRIAVEVCDSPEASNDRVSKAMSRLKFDLKQMGSSRVADSIDSEPGAYCLRP